jgi:hypothetical protein
VKDKATEPEVVEPPPEAKDPRIPKMKIGQPKLIQHAWVAGTVEVPPAYEQHWTGKCEYVSTNGVRCSDPCAREAVHKGYCRCLHHFRNKRGDSLDDDDAESKSDRAEATPSGTRDGEDSIDAESKAVEASLGVTEAPCPRCRERCDAGSWADPWDHCPNPCRRAKNHSGLHKCFQPGCVTGVNYVPKVHACLVVGSGESTSSSTGAPSAFLELNREKAKRERNTCRSCNKENLPENKFCGICGGKLDVMMPQKATRDEAQERVREAEKAVEQANAALREAKKALKPADQPIPESDEEIEVGWEVVSEALKARVKKGAASERLKAKSSQSRQAQAEPIRLSYPELEELLPFLDKEQKKQLMKQLKTQEKGLFEEVVAGMGKASSASSGGSGYKAKEPEIPPEPRAALKARLDRWRRDLYVKQLDRHGSLVPSACASVPTAKQSVCPHPFEALKWGANASAHYAKCGDCLLPHVIYWSNETREAFVVSTSAATTGPAVPASGAEPIAGDAAPSSEGITAAWEHPASPEENAAPRPPEAPREGIQDSDSEGPGRKWNSHCHQWTRVRPSADSDARREGPDKYWDRAVFAKVLADPRPEKVQITLRGSHALPRNWDPEVWGPAARAIHKANPDEHQVTVGSLVDFRTILRRGNPYHSSVSQGRPPSTNFNFDLLGGVAEDLDICEGCLHAYRGTNPHPWRLCKDCSRIAQDSLDRTATIDEFMYPAMPTTAEGRQERPVDSKSEENSLAYPGYEPDWISLVRELFQRKDPDRVSSAADLVLQSRPKERTLYRRLCRLYEELPDEDKYDHLPRQGYCFTCDRLNPHFALRCIECDAKLLHTDVPPDCVDLLPALPDKVATYEERVVKRMNVPATAAETPPAPSAKAPPEVPPASVAKAPSAPSPAQPAAELPKERRTNEMHLKMKAAVQRGGERKQRRLRKRQPKEKPKRMPLHPKRLKRIPSQRLILGRQSRRTLPGSNRHLKRCVPKPLPSVQKTSEKLKHSRQGLRQLSSR